MLDSRPDPDALLQSINSEEKENRRGKLKIFFGMCAGVGKTYEMLKAAHDALSKHIDLAVGYVETHGRPETEALLAGLPVIPRKACEYRGSSFFEMDLDAILERKPRLVLVDELAHTNIPGSRHKKRFQDVAEILDNGIDVYTTLNVQHLESHADTVAQISGVAVRETVPDSIFDSADEVEVIDLTPAQLLKRLEEGKVYTPDRAARARDHFFQHGNLTALREMALRLTAERVDRQLRDYMKQKRIPGPWKSGNRLLVAIDESESCPALVRYARRQAHTMDASWIAAFVETPKVLTESERLQLSRNVKLAKELGAEFMTTPDHDLVRGVIRLARQQNVSQIIVDRSFGKKPGRRALVEHLIRSSGPIDVCVAGQDKPPPSFYREFLPELHSQWQQYLFACAYVAIVALIAYPLSPIVGYQTVSLLLLVTVAILPLRFSGGPVLAAATTSALVWNFFFIPPKFTFSIAKIEDILMFGTYFIIAATTGVLTARIRSRERGLVQREERAVALYSLTKMLVSGRSQEEVVSAAVESIRKHFEAETVIFLSDSDGDFVSNPHPRSTLEVDAKEAGVASWCYWNERKAGRFTDTLPEAKATYFPMSGPRYPLGVIGVSLPSRPALDHESLLENFVAQISSALEREFLNELAKKSIVLAESERLYQTLFNSISHELRTPVAAILSATESLQASENRTDRDRAILSELTIAAERLHRLLDNLLDMSRLESGLLKPRLDWTDLRDVINAARDNVLAEGHGRSIEIVAREELPLVRADFGLIEQTIANLLHNAIVHTPQETSIWLTAEVRDGWCLVAVEDNGPGMPPEAMTKVFDKFYRLPGSASGGSGLGLSIAKGFVEVHNGTLTVEGRPGGGTRFVIKLPVATPGQTT